MGSGGEGLGGGDGGATVAKAKSSYYRSKPRTEKDREVGVRYTPTSTPGMGVRTEATIMKTGPSGELARTPGVSPGGVIATVGILPTVSADLAAANIAGKEGLNVANLGDLARRARVGNAVSPIPTPNGVGLQAIGRVSAADTLTKLASSSSSKAVKDVRGGIAGVVKDGVYSGRMEYKPTNNKTILSTDEKDPAKQETAENETARALREETLSSKDRLESAVKRRRYLGAGRGAGADIESLLGQAKQKPK